MPNLFIYLLLVLFIFLNACVSNTKEIKKANLHNKLALSLMKKCQYPIALAELRKAIKLNPKEALFHYSIALLYFQFKRYKKTIYHLKESIKLKPDFTDAHIHLGQSLIAINKWKPGLKKLQEAKKDLTYRYVENIHTHLGKAYYKKKQFILAEKNFNAARKVNKKNCSIALYHAKSLYFLKDFKKSFKILKSAKQWCQKDLPQCMSPSFEAYFFTALIFKKQGYVKKAIVNLHIFLNKTKNNIYVAEAKKYITQWQKRGLK